MAATRVSAAYCARRFGPPALAARAPAPWRLPRPPRAAIGILRPSAPRPRPTPHPPIPLISLWCLRRRRVRLRRRRCRSRRRGRRRRRRLPSPAADGSASRASLLAGASCSSRAATTCSSSPCTSMWPTRSHCPKAGRARRTSASPCRIKRSLSAPWLRMLTTTSRCALATGASASLCPSPSSRTRVRAS